MITFYAQSEKPCPTMTFGELAEKLAQLPQDAPVVFKSPLYGCFGSNTAYSIDAVTVTHLERRVHHIPACVGYDEETGEEYPVEAEDQVFHAWSGVVIE